VASCGRDPKVRGRTSPGTWFTGIETPDKNSLVLTTDAPRPSMFDFFEWLNILDPVTMKGPDAKTKSVGTGPFVFVEWKQGESLTFAKNANYWQTGKPYIDGFIARTSRRRRRSSLEAGAIDMVRTEAVTTLSGSRRIRRIAIQQLRRAYEFGINITKPPYDDKWCGRRSTAIDRQRYATSIMQGLVKPLALFWSRPVPPTIRPRTSRSPST
jgi:peptide/nickel transport system substrate-binding protein